MKAFLLSAQNWIYMFRFGLITNVCVISWLAFSRGALRDISNYNDKVGHAFAFFVLAVFIDGAFPKLSFLWLKVPILLSYGLFIEMVQYHLTYRTFSLADVVADAIGLCLYFPFSSWLKSRLALQQP